MKGYLENCCVIPGQMGEAGWVGTRCSVLADVVIHAAFQNEMSRSFERPRSRLNRTSNDSTAVIYRPTPPHGSLYL